MRGIRNSLPGRFQPLRVLHLLHFVRADVHGYLEILVSGPEGKNCAKHDQGKKAASYKLSLVVIQM